MNIKNQAVGRLLDEIYEKHLTIPNISFFIKGEYQSTIGFPDKSFKALQKNKLIRGEFLERIDSLRQIDDLSNYDQLCLDVAEYFIETMMFPVRCAMEDFYYLEFGITPYELPFDYFWGSLHLYDCSTSENVLKHMTLTKDYIRFTKQMLEKLNEQVKRGIYLFKDMIPSTCQMLQSFASVAYAQHPLCMAREGSMATREQIETERNYIKEANQNLFNLIELLESPEYQQNAPTEPGWGQFEDGLAYYRHLRSFHLNEDIDSSVLHQLGFELLAKANHRQAVIRKRLGFNGSHETFVDNLRGNERFFPTTPESLGGLMRSILKNIQNNMVRFFNETIQTPYQVQRLNPELEASLTFGYFQPSYNVDQAGIYFYNGSKLEEKNQLSTPALLAHEIIPGHHFQQSYIYENEDIHPLFKLFFAPVLLEGWAEYSATLLGEEGVFDDYDIYGLLENDKFACVRLIVDTGLNELGWSLEKARRFMVEHTFASEAMAVSETNRYTYCIPAQCLSYKYGMAKLVQLRNQVREVLGDQYDPKEFHTLVLNAGCIPMPILERFMLNAYGLG